MGLAQGLLLAFIFAAPPPQVDRAVSKVFADGRYQTELPSAESAPTPRPADTRRRRAQSRRTLEDRQPLRSAARALMWTLAGVAGLILLIWIVRQVRAPTTRETALPVTAAPAPTAAARSAPSSLEEAEMLAQQGSYAAAVHRLLLISLSRLTANRKPLAPSLTSREIVARARSLPKDARAALGDLVLAVEVSRFGGVTPREEDYKLCMERFRAFGACLSGAAA